MNKEQELHQQHTSNLAAAMRGADSPEQQELFSDLEDLTAEQRIRRLERRRDAHYRATVNLSGTVNEMKSEIQEIVALFKQIKTLIKFLIVAGTVLKWSAGILTAFLIIKTVAGGHLKSTLWE